MSVKVGEGRHVDAPAAQPFRIVLASETGPPKPLPRGGAEGIASNQLDKLEKVERIVNDPGLWSAYSARREELRIILDLPEFS